MTATSSYWRRRLGWNHRVDPDLPFGALNGVPTTWAAGTIVGMLNIVISTCRVMLSGHCRQSADIHAVWPMPSVPVIGNDGVRLSLNDTASCRRYWPGHSMDVAGLVKLLAMAMISLPKSPSLMPVARHWRMPYVRCRGLWCRNGQSDRESWVYQPQANSRVQPTSGSRCVPVRRTTTCSVIRG